MEARGGRDTGDSASGRSRNGTRPDADQGADATGQDPARLDFLDLVELWPTMARMGALASLRAAGWTTSNTVAVMRRVATAARSGESVGELIGDARAQALGAARKALGVTEIEQQLSRFTSGAPSGDGTGALGLKERGEQLMAQSADVDAPDGGHPAFSMVLEELAPDEVRVLHVLMTQGDQPSVDVEATGPLGVGGRKVAHRLTMLHKLAGCRHPALIQLYTDNLLRLGLMALSAEPLDDEEEYQVLEAQPEVLKAQEEAQRTKVVRGRVALTHFGRCFCEICVPLEEPAKRGRARVARRSRTGSNGPGGASSRGTRRT
jgi:hypothetical protein